MHIKNYRILLILVCLLHYTQTANSQHLNNTLDTFFEREYIPLFVSFGYDVANFCPDGLLKRGFNGEESRIWKRSNLRICFLLKDPNGSEDARNYSRVNNSFGYRLGAWAYGLNMIYKAPTHSKIVGHYPDKSEIAQAFKEKPIAIINIKKASGQSTVANSQITKFGAQFGSKLREQLSIICPNVIICGGDVVFSVLKKNIFSNVSFTNYKNKNILYYSRQERLVVICFKHPSARVSNAEMYFPMMDVFCEFLKDSTIKSDYFFYYM